MSGTDIERIEIKRENYETLYNLLKSKIRYKAWLISSQSALDQEHVESLLSLALLEAIDSWDEYKRKECKFTSFFWTKCNFVVLDELAKVRTTPNAWGRRSSEPAICYMGDLLTSSAEKFDDNGNDLEDIIYTKFVECASIDANLHFKDTYRKLLKVANPEAKRTLLKLYKGFMVKGKPDSNCDTLASVSKKMNVSLCCVKNRLKRVVQNFEKKYGKISEVV